MTMGIYRRVPSFCLCPALRTWHTYVTIMYTFPHLLAIVTLGKPVSSCSCSGEPCYDRIVCCYCPSSVHGFERSIVLVNEGDEVTLNVSLDIKGNTTDEPAEFQVTRINFTVVCEDMTTGE